MSFYYMFVKILPKCINLSFQESSTLAKLKKQMKTDFFGQMLHFRSHPLELASNISRKGSLMTQRESQH